MSAPKMTTDARVVAGSRKAHDRHRWILLAATHHSTVAKLVAALKKNRCYVSLRLVLVLRTGLGLPTDRDELASLGQYMEEHEP